MNNKAMFTALALFAALFAAASSAQQTRMEYPAARVRVVRPASSAPEPYYDQNRVILKRLDLSAAGGGMQISGEVFVDFDCDRAPGSLKLPSGPVMGLKLDAQLYMVNTVLQRASGWKVRCPSSIRSSLVSPWPRSAWRQPKSRPSLRWRNPASGLGQTAGAGRVSTGGHAELRRSGRDAA